MKSAGNTNMSHCSVMPNHTGDTPMLNTSDSSSDTSAIIIISGVVGGVILLLIITMVLCTVVLCVRRSCRKKKFHVYDQVLYSRTILNTSVVINQNPLYDVSNANKVDTFHEARDSNINSPSSHSAIYEEAHNYEYACPQDVIEMDTNSSFGVCTVENRAPVFNGNQNHQPSDSSHDHDHYNYIIHDDATQLHHNTSATGDVEDEIPVNTTVDESLVSEVEYGVINQPRCDDYDYNDTGDHDHDAKNVQLFKLPLVARPDGEYEYGVINQPRCDDPIIISQGHTPTTCLFPLPFIANSTGEDEYGTINQPQSDNSTINTTQDTTVNQ